MIWLSGSNDMVEIFRMIAFRLNIACPLHDYTPVQTVSGLSSLAGRRHLANLLFLTKLSTNQIDSPFLLSSRKKKQKKGAMSLYIGGHLLGLEKFTEKLLFSLTDKV